MYPFASMKTHRHTDHKLSNILYSNVQGGPKKPDCFYKFVTPVYVDIE